MPSSQTSCAGCAGRCAPPAHRLRRPASQPTPARACHPLPFQAPRPRCCSMARGPQSRVPGCRVLLRRWFPYIVLTATGTAQIVLRRWCSSMNPSPSSPYFRSMSPSPPPPGLTAVVPADRAWPRPCARHHPVPHHPATEVPGRVGQGPGRRNPYRMLSPQAPGAAPPCQMHSNPRLQSGITLVGMPVMACGSARPRLRPNPPWRMPGRLTDRPSEHPVPSPAMEPAVIPRAVLGFSSRRWLWDACTRTPCRVPGCHPCQPPSPSMIEGPFPGHPTICRHVLDQAFSMRQAAVIALGGQGFMPPRPSLNSRFSHLPDHRQHRAHQEPGRVPPDGCLRTGASGRVPPDEIEWPQAALLPTHPIRPQ